ncbi:hypothetical protein HY948_03475 [Candidatus Gottesmanbacteria bacterium]|nr:hypothetical protein [Candidatus Gottesmanbacteria bacterium]
MLYSRHLVLFLATLALISANHADAVWKAPLSPPTGDNTEPALNIGSSPQEKLGGLTVGSITAKQSGWILGRVGVGRLPDNRPTAVDPVSGHTIVTVGDVKAPRFCLGTACISNWQDGFGLSGGRTGFFVKWLSGSDVGYSSGISESGGRINIGGSANLRNVNLSAGVKIGSGSVAGSSGLKLESLSLLTPSELAALAKKNFVLSVDALGEVILVEACRP